MTSIIAIVQVTAVFTAAILAAVCLVSVRRFRARHLSETAIASPADPKSFQRSSSGSVLPDVAGTGRGHLPLDPCRNSAGTS